LIAKSLEKKALATLSKSLKTVRVNTKLKTTSDYEILRKRVKKRGPGKWIFKGYADPLARPLFEAMGMSGKPYARLRDSRQERLCYRLDVSRGASKSLHNRP